MAMIIGAAFLVLADLAARTVVSPSELPVGVVTAFLWGTLLSVSVYGERGRGHESGRLH